MEKVSDNRSCFQPVKFAPIIVAKVLCMNIYVNNNVCELPATAVITDALQSMNISAQKGIALAVNSTVVPLQEWGNYTLNENDKIIIIKATQGG